MQISDVQFLFFYEPLRLSEYLNCCPGHWVWNLVLGEPQINWKRQKRRKKSTYQIHVYKNRLNISSTLSSVSFCQEK